jgi:hypothetical protein
MLMFKIENFLHSTQTSPSIPVAYVLTAHVLKILFTSGLQLPQPKPAPDDWQSSFRLVHPPSMSLTRLPSPTWLQEHIIFPTTGSEFLPDRSSFIRFSESSILLSISVLNSANSDLSPIKIAPTSLSSFTMHFL